MIVWALAVSGVFSVRDFGANGDGLVLEIS